MIKTPYQITQEGIIFTVTHEGTIIARCFDHIENALHSIFVTEGSKEGYYYVLYGEDVYLTKKEVEL
ncbi:MAG: hypothetical protein IBX43_05155 [Campylobacterales bacterium]|nr:hypothetical protein [Campylobacterales bacterium]